MKLMLKLVFIVVLALSLITCGDNDDNGGNREIDIEINGSYTFTVDSYTHTLVFNNDGAWQFTSGSGLASQDKSGTWSVKGSTLTMNASSPVSISEKFTVSSAGSSWTITIQGNSPVSNILSLFPVLGTSLTMAKNNSNNPILMGTVTITGTAIVGQILTANIDDIEGSNGIISFQWKRNGTINIGTNSNIYEVETDDIGSTITVTVICSGYSGSIISEATASVKSIQIVNINGSYIFTSNYSAFYMNESDSISTIIFNTDGFFQIITSLSSDAFGTWSIEDSIITMEGIDRFGDSIYQYKFNVSSVGNSYILTGDYNRYYFDGKKDNYFLTSMLNVYYTNTITITEVNSSNDNNGNINVNSALLGKWYSGIELYDFRSDGKLYILGSDHGVTYTVSGNTITTYVTGSQPRIATFSISGSGSLAKLYITAPNLYDIYAGLASGNYSRY
jgi:hypothetical protein